MSLGGVCARVNCHVRASKLIWMSVWELYSPSANAFIVRGHGCAWCYDWFACVSVVFVMFFLVRSHCGQCV